MDTGIINLVRIGVSLTDSSTMKLSLYIHLPLNLDFDHYLDLDHGLELDLDLDLELDLEIISSNRKVMINNLFSSIFMITISVKYETQVQDKPLLTRKRF